MSEQTALILLDGAGSGLSTGSDVTNMSSGSPSAGSVASGSTPAGLPAEIILSNMTATYMPSKLLLKIDLVSVV